MPLKTRGRGREVFAFISGIFQSNSESARGARQSYSKFSHRLDFIGFYEVVAQSKKTAWKKRSKKKKPAENLIFRLVFVAEF
jgi:hypothetical protein